MDAGSLLDIVIAPRRENSAFGGIVAALLLSSILWGLLVAVVRFVVG